VKFHWKPRGGLQSLAWNEGDEKLDGGSPVLFDAVALLLTKEGTETLATEPTARDFVAYNFAHAKFIGHTQTAEALLQKVVPTDERDAGFVSLNSADEVSAFIEGCRKLRHWERENRIKQI